MKILKRKRMLQKMTKKTLPILFISFMTATAFAFNVNRMTWQISDTVTNAYLYEKLTKIEQLAKTSDLQGAATLIDDLRCDAAVKDYVSSDGEPLALVLVSASLWYRAESVRNSDNEIVKEAREQLNQWAEKAKDKQWKSYKYLFHRIRAYYVTQKNQRGRIETQKEMILYDPFDQEQLKSFEEYCDRFPESVGDLSSFLEKYKSKGGVMTPKFTLTLITLSDKSREEKLKELSTWLKEHKGSDLETLKLGIEFGMGEISVEEPQTVKKMYDLLTDLALWQPADEERMPIIAMILNERAKVETIAPEAVK